MKIQRNYDFHSTLAQVIKGLIDEKRASGYSYSSNENVLKELDNFCLDHNFICVTVTKELADAWSVQRPTEGLNARNIRVSVLRQLSKYLLSLGTEAYIPKLFQSKETSEAHVFTADELLAFFENLDNLEPARQSYGVRLINECKVLFRLYYCCGMRRNEPLQLTWECVDLEAGTIHILQSKGDKDRILWLTDDIIGMLKKYRSYIQKERPDTNWVFPGTKEDNHLNETSVRDYFLRVWGNTPYSWISNPPTIKSFRHTFVVDRLNSWMEAGENVQEKLLYLSKFLGHASVYESLYYYHQVAESFKIIHAKDKTSHLVIPEVNINEKKDN